MSTHAPKTILVMGLNAGIKQEHQRWTLEATLAAVAEQKQAVSGLNITLDNHQLDPSLPLSQHLSEVKTLLNSKAYDGVSIGFGVRGNEKFTDLFTALVNLVVEEGRTAEGKSPKLMFALRPDGLVDAVKGVWGEYEG